MTRSFFNQKAATWDETNSEPDAAKLEEMAERLEIEPASTILDVGSGTGVFLPYLLSRTNDNVQVVALDFAEEMLKRARGKSLKRWVDYLHADATAIPVRSEAFDIVLCYSSFPHFQNKRKALSEIKRVIKTGGRLLICHTSSRAEINDIHRQIPDLENDLIPGQDEMKKLLSHAGFTDIKIDDGTSSYLVSARK